MPTRRGFLKSIFGAAVGVATGGLGKVFEALSVPSFKIRTIKLKGTRRKLGPGWTVEILPDMVALHDKSVERELCG